MEAYIDTRRSLEPFKEIKITSAPKSYEEIANRIIVHESMKLGLQKLESLFNEDGPSSLIIAGYPSGGKTTMVRLALWKSGLKTIYLNSEMISSDVSTIHYLLGELSVQKSKSMMKETLSDTMSSIKANAKKFKEHFVVVLCDYESFCRKSQLLLYNLTDMLVYGINMTLICITSSRDCTENLEKRVRSRISSSFFHFGRPYEKPSRYVEFASALLGGFKFTTSFKKILKKKEFRCKDLSMVSLKRFLIDSFEFTGKTNKLRLKLTTKPKDHKPLDDNVGRFSNQLDWLPDLYVLTRIVAYCKRQADVHLNQFKLSDVILWHKVCMMPVNQRRFNLGAIRTLMKANFICKARESDRLGLETDLVLLIPFRFFKLLVESKPQFKNDLADRIFSLR